MKVKLLFRAAIIALSFFFNFNASAQITYHQDPDCLGYEGIPMDEAGTDATGRKYYSFGGGVFTLEWRTTRWEVNGPVGLVASHTSTSMIPPLTGWTPSFCTGSNVNLTSAVPLPVELTKFTAQANSKTVLLQWETASETNNKGFDIELSVNAKNWKSIGWKAGNGTTQSTSRYAFEHDAAANGTHYYRLRQVDLDGSAKYTKVVSVTSGDATKNIKAYPTTFQDALTVETTTDELGLVQVFNATGQVVFSKNSNSSIEVLQLGHLASGVYFLNINSNGQPINQKIMRL
jgi:hypothetical protein